MRVKMLLAALLAPILAVVLGTAPSSADPVAGGLGLWSNGYAPATAPTDCGLYFSWTYDSNNFCIADDPTGVELGVKFTTSRATQITGVRFYRADPGASSVSLWASGGGLLATASVAPLPAGTADQWQDVAFSSPVSIAPGTTYLASYYTPNARYAFKYDYFTNSSYTVGPITALQSVEGNGNGVYCYDTATCFPSDTYNNSNYWATPVWAYNFTGFFQPIDNAPVWNSAKAGSAIPVKFSLGGDMGLNIFKGGAPQATVTSCVSGASVDQVEQTVTAGGSSLSYDAAGGQYTYVWKTDKAWAGKCVKFELGLGDGSSHIALVQFTK
jgi:Domain of unknown function (DUF4082)